MKYATIQMLERRRRGTELVARIGAWHPEIRLNATTHFERPGTVSPPDVARHYRGVLSSATAVRRAADDWLYLNEPRHSSILRASVSPNVIPSEATAALDVRPNVDIVSSLARSSDAPVP